MAAAKATLDTVKNKIEEGNSENTRWHVEERSRQAASDAILANSSAITGGWLGKIFGGQHKARMEAAEAAREAARGKGDGGFEGIGAGFKGGKGGILGKGLKGLFSIFGALIKGPFKMLGWIARVPLMLASVTALWAGLAAVVGFFALVTVASLTMTQKDFDAMKDKIAKGVGHAVAETVDAAMKIWNSFVPDSWKISDDTAAKFKSATFTAVSETITSVIEFAEKIGKAFSSGFKGELDGFAKSWDNFKVIFDEIVAVFAKALGGTGEKAEAGMMVAAKALGAYIVKIGKFFLDLFAAVGAEALGKDAKTDNTTINTAAGIIVGIIKFIGNIVKSFGAGFATTFSGISDKFGTLKDKLGKVAEKIGKLFESVGEGAKENETTIMGVFNMMGKGLGKLIEGILSVANFIADLIIDPTVTLAKAQVSIEEAFNTMGRNISNFLEGIFNKESMLIMLKGMLGESVTGRATFAAVEGFFGTVEEAAAEREKDMVREGERLRTKNTIMEKSAKETDRQLKEALKKESSMRTDEEDAKVRRLQLALSREQNEIKANEAALERIEDNIAVSAEVQLQAKVDAAMGEEATAAERKNRVLKKEVAQLEEGAIARGRGQVTGMAGLKEEEIRVGGYRSAEFTAGEFEKFSAEILQKTGTTTAELASGQTKLTQEMQDIMFRYGIKKTQMDEVEEQQKIFSAGLQRMNEIAAKQAEIDAKKLVLAETEVELAKKRKDIEAKIRKQEGLPAKEVVTKPTKATPLAVKPSKVVTDTVEAVKETVKPVMKTAEVAAKSAEPLDEKTIFNNMITLFEEDKKFKLREKNTLEDWIFASSDPRKYLKMATDSDLMGMFKGLRPDRRARNWAKTMRKQLPADVRNLQEGGLVAETGMAMLHGTVPKPELVLDNQAAALFMEAALIIKGIGLSSGVNLMDLQRESSAVQQTGAVGVVSIVNNSPQQVNQNQAMVLPPSPISPFNSDSPRLLN